MNAEPNDENQNGDVVEMIRALARQSVDTAIEQSIRCGTDPLDAIIGAIAFNTEALHWAREAKARIEAQRKA